MEITATPEQVWSILLDFPSHPEWNSFIRRIEGLPNAGERLTVSIQPPGGKGMTFRPTVLKSTPNRELRWLGRFIVPGIFDGEHSFIIEPLTDSKVRFTHGEKFSGMLVPFVKSSLDRKTKAGFMAMNEALKRKAESSSR